MRNLEILASQCLTETGMHSFPVPVEEVAKTLGAEVTYEPFEGELSGMLYRDGERKVIGINSAHSQTRQRFSLAHEIAHLRLHKGRPVIVDKIVQDKLVRLNMRDAKSSQATDREEIEANQFAAALLMPRDMILKEVSRRVSRRLSVAADELVRQMAHAFQVSPEAMDYRLINLGLRQPH
jgi:Zn-dependent peptidase ImmA (M78 family)